MTTKEASKLWNISDRRVRELCKVGKIEGAELIGNTWFIPNDAIKPKDARYKANDSLYEKILELKKELDNKRPLTEGELEALNNEFIVEYTYNSNAIEGNTLTLRETDLVLKGITIDKKPLKDHLEAISHKDAFEFVSTLVKSNVKLSTYVIKEIHSLVLSFRLDDKGKFRRVPVMIMGAKHTPIQPYLIEPKLEELLEWYYKSEDNFIEKLARFHIEFESIHPFIDGNGRTGRLLVNLELMKLGYPPIDIKFKDRLSYYNAFDAYHVNNDIKPMANLFASYLYETLNKYVSILD